MKFSWHGLVEYEQGLRLQQDLHAQVLAGGPDQIIGLEHPTVITLGVRGDQGRDLKGALDGFSGSVVQTDRGGQATLHSPGQLVIYPIVDLRRNPRGVRCFVADLLQATADLLNQAGIAAHRDDARAGVFTERGKIAFCGLRVDRGVTRHGLSLNISNDLGLFRRIRPCGRDGENLSSWNEMAPGAMTPQQAFTQWQSHFLKLRAPQCAVL